MNARYYPPAIGRFLTRHSRENGNTLVPDPSNPQSFNRYSYVLNNPLRFTDPTGHNPVWCNDPYDAGGGADCAPLVDFDVADGAKASWLFDEKSKVMLGAAMIDFAFMRYGSSFLKVYGGTVTFEKTGISASNLGEATSKNHILVNEHSIVDITGETIGAMWAAHELGHAFNYALHPNTTDKLSYGQGIIDLALEGVWVGGERIAGNTTQSYADDNFYRRTEYGYQEGIYQRNGGPFQQNTASAVSEDFADMFMNWAFNSFADNDAGAVRYNFMDSHMSAWISLAVTNNQ